MRVSMKRWILSFVLCGVITSSQLYAKSQEFNFKDPKRVNAMTFVLDSKLEPIMGLATDISGTVHFDPARPEKTTGKIIVASKSVNTTHKGMTGKLHSAEWLDSKGYPEISFTFKKIENVERQKNKVILLTVVGDFQCKGTTKEITVPVKATFLPRKAGDRLRGVNGDLLVLRVDFTIARSDFGIKPDMGPDTVAEDIEITIRIVGYSSK